MSRITRTNANGSTVFHSGKPWWKFRHTIVHVILWFSLAMGVLFEMRLYRISTDTLSDSTHQETIGAANLRLDGFSATRGTTNQHISTSVHVPYHVPFVPASKNEIPSNDKPFIFFHQRKCGGTTIKNEIHRAANKLKATTFITCKSGIDCESYYTPHTIPKKVTHTVYAGHLYWSLFMRTLYLRHHTPALGVRVDPPPHKFTCLTIFREPLSRISSCWNFRMIQQTRKKKEAPRFNDIAAADMAAKLASGRSDFGEGCLNEPMRIFSDLGVNEETVNTLSLAGDGRQAAGELALHQTMERAGQCVVGILERCDDTKAVIAAYLPFLAPFFSCEEKHFNSARVQNKKELSEEQKLALSEVAKYEIRAYEGANAMLDAQLLASK